MGSGTGGEYASEACQMGRFTHDLGKFEPRYEKG